MMPGTHFLASWMIANTKRLGRADIAAIVVAGVIPDLDGIGYPVQWLSPTHPWYTDYHHVIGHNLWVALLVTFLVLLWRRKLVVALLAFVAFHVHLLCDLVGSGGLHGEPWPILYLWPLSNKETLVTWQWPLDSPINMAITLILEVAMLVLAVRRGYSPIVLFSPRADQYVFRLVGRAKLGRPPKPPVVPKQIER
jgi:membrane-bound metal-dependent hydrolase YbcI (DUF457 family)